MHESTKYSKEVKKAIKDHKPIVALESAVITHGLPRPINLVLAQELEKIVIRGGATPATIAILNGEIHIGLSKEELNMLASLENTRKISQRDFGIAISSKMSGGTTVASTIFTAHRAGIKVFATGGIGGVHRGVPYDVSADLIELANVNLIVVCSGAKAILDLPATLEVLETYGVPVIGYQTHQFPAFYSSESGLLVDYRANSIEDIVAIANAHWGIGIRSSILVAVPPPKASALDNSFIETKLQQALKEAQDKNIHGAATTPFLLERMNQLTDGLSMKSNLDLLRNNAGIAAQIAVSLTRSQNKQVTLGSRMV